MAHAIHVTKQAGGWTVQRSDGTSSVHRSRSEAIAAGRRAALKRGGAELVVHGADGAIREATPVGAATLDAAKRDATIGRPPRERAPRSEGPRTTLRVPDALVDTAERMAGELGISRNDALLRLATRGAQLYEREQSIALRREQRWAAIVPGVLDDAGFPSPAEATGAILAARGDAPAVD